MIDIPPFSKASVKNDLTWAFSIIGSLQFAPCTVDAWPTKPVLVFTPPRYAVAVLAASGVWPPSGYVWKLLIIYFLANPKFCKFWILQLLRNMNTPNIH